MAIVKKIGLFILLLIFWYIIIAYLSQIFNELKFAIKLNSVPTVWHFPFSWGFKACGDGQGGPVMEIMGPQCPVPSYAPFLAVSGEILLLILTTIFSFSFLKKIIK